jgi:hypothetical protein
MAGKQQRFGGAEAQGDTSWLTLTVPLLIMLAIGALVARHAIRRWYRRLTAVHTHVIPAARQRAPHT